jgi:hypothetical protein
MTAPAILAYKRTGEIVTTSGGGPLLVDWVNNFVYIGYGGISGGTDSGWAKFDGNWPNDTELLEKSSASIGIPNVETALFNRAQLNLSYNGYLVFTADAANWPAWYIVKADTLTLNRAFGSPSRSIASPGNAHIGNPTNTAPLRQGTPTPLDYMVITAGRSVNVLPIPGSGNDNTYLGQVDEHSANAGPGSVATTGTAFVLGVPNIGGSLYTAGLYKISVTSGVISWAKLGTFNPADVDPTWTKFGSVIGCGYDQTDGHVLISCETNESVTNKAYIVKLSSVDASVIWACHVGNFNNQSDASNLPRANIVNGTLYYGPSGTNFYTIDTTAGTAVLTVVGNLSGGGVQVSDDVSQSIFVDGTWSETSTHPTYLGSYMGPPGNNHTISSKLWMRFWNGTYPPPTPPTTFTLRRATAGARAGSINFNSPIPVAAGTVIPSYLYQEYNDDDDMQAFVAAYNTYAQAFLDWFNSLHLPVYTGDPISGALLDWVAQGLYGMARPALGSGMGTTGIGPFDTYLFNELELDGLRLTSSADNVLVTDDIFRRILTWHIERRYGKIFNIRWLKLRIVQFLNGINGIPLNIDNTYGISVTLGPGNIVNINFPTRLITDINGLIFDEALFNEFALDELNVASTPLPPTPNVALLRAAIESGALELPFQFTYVVNG